MKPLMRIGKPGLMVEQRVSSLVLPRLKLFSSKPKISYTAPGSLD